jgi:hypothetical protein
MYKNILIAIVITILFLGTCINSPVAIDNLTDSVDFPLKNGALAYWAFDECSGTTAGDSIHGYDGTIIGATWTTDGYSGCALVFDGEDDYVDLDAYAQNLGLNKTDDYVISAYFKSTSTSTGSIYSMSHTNVARAFAYLDLNANGTISYKTGDQTCLFELYTSKSYNDGIWHFVEVKFYGEKVNPTLEIWVDEVLDCSLTEWLCPYLAEDFITAKIGRRSSEEMDYFDGVIDEFKIYKWPKWFPPPPQIVIYGPSLGRSGIEYEYIITIFDSEGLDFILHVDWGDGTSTDCEYSGESIKLNHAWVKEGTYIIHAEATDWYGRTIFGNLVIEIPRTRTSSYHWFLERFPLLERLLTFLWL